MFLSSITEQGATPALVKAMEFAEARASVIADNVANIQTPGYRAKSLDPRGFQRALREALDARELPGDSLHVADGRELKTDAGGRLHVAPSTAPGQNVLFHDGTNLSIERQMSDLAETAMAHELSATLLKGNWDRLRAAIRGRAG